MKISRRRLVLSGGAVFSSIGIARFPAGAAEFTYKMATDKEPTHPTAIRLLEAVEKIKQESNGRLEIKVFLNNALGGQAEMPTQIRMGAVEFSCSYDATFANTVPVVGMTALPFIVTKQRDALGLLEGPLGAYIRGAVARIDVFSFGHSWDNGFRQMITGVRPIQAPDDLKGLKIRTPPSAVSTALFKALGASPTSISANEMYVALQTHLVDGTEVPLSTIEVYKLYEVQKYVSYTNHMWTPFTILANGPAWRRLPKNLRDITERNINVAGNLNNADFVKLMATLESKLQGQGMQFNTADESAFRATVRKAGLYAQWRETYGAEAWALLEKSVGKLV